MAKILMRILQTVAVSAVSLSIYLAPLAVSAAESKKEGVCSMDNLVAATDKFGMKLFRDLAADAKNTNCFISPASVAIALNLAFAGASGDTRKEMAQALGLPEEGISQAMKTLLDSLLSKDPKVEMNIANALFVHDKFSLNSDYKNVAQSDFNSEIRTEDFSKPVAVQAVNSWVADKTKGHIKQLVSKLSPESMAVLLNAIYFKGKWQNPFDAAKTKEGDFKLSAGSAKKLPMMNHAGKFQYVENERFQAILLPYGEGRFNAFVLLPNENLKLKELEQDCTDENWEKWLASLKSASGSLTMPKFTLDYSQHLNDSLKRLGLGAMYSGQADFSKIHTPPPGLRVGDVVHKTTLQVDEEGTVATAATGVVMMATAFRPEKRFNMVVDRPFIFAIQDSKTGLVIFIGSVYDPELIK